MSSIRIPRRLIEKHNKPGPRYTSYPTVPVWSRSVGEDEYRAALSDLAQQPGDELSVYLHLPFCVKHCLYCGCNSVATREAGAVDRYLDRIEQELGMVTALLGTGRRVVQMHWGGGTPNYLTLEQIERASGLFQHAFGIDGQGELSLEVDPRVGTAEQAAHLRQLGFNRISLGVQDFDPGVQRAIGRVQPMKRTVEFFAACREAGFPGVNLDLVYGLPGQTRESFAGTLETVLELEPDRVACFSYAHVPWVRPSQERIDAALLPDPFEKFALFQMAIDRFAQDGYVWIGLDHFARPRDQLSEALRERRLHRNFMGYTTRPAPHMLAFGMSGIGEVADRFLQNDADLNGYAAAIAGGRLPIVRGHRLSEDDRLRRMVILHLMCNLELPYQLTTEQFGARLDALLPDELARIREYEAEGFVEFNDDRLTVTDLGRFFIRNVCMELDAYLERDSDRPLFSKTV